METLFQPQTANCDRCGKKLRVATERTKGQPFHKSLGPKGCCIECAATCFLKTSPLAEVCGGAWSAPGFSPAMAFSLPHVQEQFAAVLRAGGIGDSAQEINWQQLIENWELPMPAGWDWGGEIYISRKGKPRARKG